MIYQDLREFIAELENRGELKRIATEVDANLEITEICRRTLDQQGPALLFENVKDSNIPVLANLFGTTGRVASAMGQEDLVALRELGKLLAELKQPEPPKGLKDAIKKLPTLKKVLNMPVKSVKKGQCQEVITKVISSKLLRERERFMFYRVSCSSPLTTCVAVEPHTIS